MRTAPAEQIIESEAAMSSHVVLPGGGRSFGPGIAVKVEHGASASFASFESELPPDWPGPPPHVHFGYDEAFYVISGSVSFSLDGANYVCPAGSFVFVPRGSTHGFGTGPEPAKILVIVTPEAIRLVEELYELGMEAEPQAVVELFARFGSEIVLGPPDG